MSQDNKEYLTKTIHDKINIIKNHDSFKDATIGEDHSTKIAKEVYLASLKTTSITPEQIKELQAHDHEYFAAVTHITGEMGMEHFDKNKDATKVTVVAALPGKGKYSAVITKEEKFYNPQSKEEVTKYGNITNKLVTSHAKKDNGSISTVIAHFNKLAKDKFAD